MVHVDACCCFLEFGLMKTKLRKVLVLFWCFVISFFFLIISIPVCIIFQKLQYWIQLEMTAVLFCHSTKAFCLKFSYLDYTSFLKPNVQELFIRNINAIKWKRILHDDIKKLD